MAVSEFRRVGFSCGPATDGGWGFKFAGLRGIGSQVSEAWVRGYYENGILQPCKRTVGGLGFELG